MTLYPHIESNAIDSSRNSFVKKLIAVLEQWYQEDKLSIPQIAKELNICESHLCRKVRAYCKTTPQLYLRDFRLIKAYPMLFDPEIRISEVAYDCGFKSAANFSRVFRDKYKISPLDIRRNLGSAG